MPGQIPLVTQVILTKFRISSRPLATWPSRRLIHRLFLGQSLPFAKLRAALTSQASGLGPRVQHEVSRPIYFLIRPSLPQASRPHPRTPLLILHNLQSSSSHHRHFPNLQLLYLPDPTPDPTLQPTPTSLSSCACDRHWYSSLVDRSDCAHNIVHQFIPSVR